MDCLFNQVIALTMPSKAQTLVGLGESLSVVDFWSCYKGHLFTQISPQRRAKWAELFPLIIEDSF